MASYRICLKISLQAPFLVRDAATGRLSFGTCTTPPRWRQRARGYRPDAGDLGQTNASRRVATPALNALLQRLDLPVRRSQAAREPPQQLLEVVGLLTPHPPESPEYVGR